MSLEGLFALGIQAESIQAPSSTSQGKGESLDGLAFLNVLAALWEHYGDLGSQKEEEPSLIVSESEASKPEAEEDVDPQASSDESQSLPDLGADLVQQAEALAVTAPDTSVAQAEPSEQPADGDSVGLSKVGGKADFSGFQKASAGQPSNGGQPSQPPPPTPAGADSLGEVAKGSSSQKLDLGARDFKGRIASPVPPSAEENKAEASPQPPKASSAEVKVTLAHSGRQIEVPQQWAALARPFEPEGKLPPRLERILEGSQERSGPDQSILRHSIKTALASQAAQPETVGAAADRLLARDAPPSSPTSEATPKKSPEPSAEDGRESDPSRQSHSAQRTGTSSANPPASAQAASSGVRFADLLQAQPNAAQPGTVLAEAQASKTAASTASGEGLQGELTTVRGQDADHVFSQVVQNARLLQSQGETRFEIRLKPEFLGKIQIESHLGADQKMTTRFLVEDPQVKILLESRLPLLAERLDESGVRMTSLEVHSMNSQTGGDLSRSAGEAAGQSRQQHQDAGRQDHPGPPRPGSQEEEIYQHQQLGRGAGRIYLVA